MNNTIDKIRRYKEMLADIADINIRVQELEEEILGVSGQSMEERTGKTYKITSSVEQQAELLIERKEQLYYIPQWWATVVVRFAQHNSTKGSKNLSFVISTLGY